MYDQDWINDDPAMNRPRRSDGQPNRTAARNALRSHPSLYDAAISLGLEIDHHESDLYLKSSPLADALVSASRRSATRFRSEIDGRQWWDIPFAFAPFWRKRTVTA